MQIPDNPIGDAFRIFPYSSDKLKNNGGIDLVACPERIEEITEALAVPALKKFLVAINRADGKMMTLGCDAGISDGTYMGYIEIAFREQERVQSRKEYNAFYENFKNWLIDQLGQENARLVTKALVPEMEPFAYPAKTLDGLRLSIWFAAQNQEAAEQLLDLLREYEGQCV